MQRPRASISRLIHRLGLSVLQCARFEPSGRIAGKCLYTWTRSTFVVASGHQRLQGLTASRFYSSEVGRKRYSHEVRTLSHERMRSESQPILDISNRLLPWIQVKHASTYAPFLCYFSGARPLMPFPPETKGVLYYNEAESQIRFRLCKTVDDFQQGRDLHTPIGRPWRIQLAQMARRPQRYGHALALLKDEFQLAPQDVDPDLDNYRTVVTFSPERLVSMKQRMLNISGLSQILIRPSGVTDSARVFFTQSKREIGLHPFPEGTSGVFYYLQSQAAPTRVGELRFRICSDIHAFDHGSDLCVPSGTPWFLSSRALQLGRYYQPIREHLVKDGLLERDLYPGVPDSMLSPKSYHVSRLGEPFVVDLSHNTFTLSFITLQPEILVSKTMINFHIRPEPVSRRAVVHFEEYQTAHGNQDRPRLAMRVLEMMSPSEQISADGHSLEAIPGELITTRGAPWCFTPRNSDTGKKIADWIRAQSAYKPTSQLS